MNCPNEPGSCMCVEHHLGLLAFTVNDEHHTALRNALDHLRGPQTITLNVLTFDPDPPTNVVEIRPCDGSYTCQCEDCDTDRARRQAQGVRRSHSMPIKYRRAA